MENDYLVTLIQYNKVRANNKKEALEIVEKDSSNGYTHTEKKVKKIR
jgi:hypothetical protein